MKIFAFDTSTHYASLALWEDQQCVYDMRSQFGTRHSERLLLELEHGLDLCGWNKHELDAIVVGTGPGSFTGLRVGVATAQGLSFALQIPLFGVSSLDALAMSAPQGPELLAVCVDARKQELYVRLYRRNSQDPTQANNEVPSPNYPTYHLHPASSHLLLKAESLAQRFHAMNEDVMLVGNGATLYYDILHQGTRSSLFVPQGQWFHHVWAGHLIAQAWPEIVAGVHKPAHEVLPLYIRPSEAEMNIGPPTGGPPLKDRIQEDGSFYPVTDS